MNNINTQKQNSTELTLILGSTGKTGRRVASLLRNRGVPIREGSRSASPAFDWDLESTWDACLRNVTGVYISYSPDLAIPGATEKIKAFVDRAKIHGIKRLVLLSGRGEKEAQACEKIVQKSGINWTIVRASWFNQNFSEGAFVDMVLAGQITLPAGETPEPFVDVDDIAEVAAVSLTEEGHVGEVYEVTGPRLMTFAEIASELSKVTSRQIDFIQIPHQDFVNAVAESGAPNDVVWLMDYLLSTILDGRNAYLTDGVQRALGRPPKDFSVYAREMAAAGVWEIAA